MALNKKVVANQYFQSSTVIASDQITGITPNIGDVEISSGIDGSLIINDYVEEWAEMVGDVVKAAHDAGDLEDKAEFTLRFYMPHTGIDIDRLLEHANKNLSNVSSTYRVTKLTLHKHISKLPDGVWASYPELDVELRDVELIDLVQD